MRLSPRIVGLIAFGLALPATYRTVAAPPEGEKHWSFTPVQRPAPPATTDPVWTRNPIDRFIRARLQAEGIRRRRPLTVRH